MKVGYEKWEWSLASQVPSEVILNPASLGIRLLGKSCVNRLIGMHSIFRGANSLACSSTSFFFVKIRNQTVHWFNEKKTVQR